MSCICCRSEHEVSGWGHIPMSWSCLESSRCFPPAAFPQLLHFWSLQYPDLGALCTSSLRLAVGSKHSAASVSSRWSVMSFLLFCFLLRPVGWGGVFTRGQTIPSCSALPFSNWIVIPLETAPVTVLNDPWTITLEIQF